jgi:hypothetical protein
MKHEKRMCQNGTGGRFGIGSGSIGTSKKICFDWKWKYRYK